jgi:hypothetical protein
MSTSPTGIDGEVAVRDANIAEKYQNHGHSVRLYRQAAEDALKNGSTVLRSDPTSINDEAARTWESLSRTEPITKSTNPVNGEPIYKWDLTAKPSAKQLPIGKRTVEAPSAAKSFRESE